MSFKQLKNFHAKIKFFLKAKLACKNLKNDNIWVQNEVFKGCNKNKNVSKEAKSFSKLVGQWGIPPEIPTLQTWETYNKISSTMQMEWEIHKDLRNKIFKLEIL